MEHNDESENEREVGMWGLGMAWKFEVWVWMGSEFGLADSLLLVCLNSKLNMNFRFKI
jgi:hypothetical protein